MSLTGSVRKHWPLLAAIALYAAAVAVLLFLSVRQNRGHLVYAYDDAYIHMSMAKNFARQGVWGVTRYGFTSASSSPLWSFLLGGLFWLFGVRQVIPLILNVLFGILAIVVSYLFLRRRSLRAFPVLAGLLLLVLATPLPSLALAGMEHSLHTFLTILFVSLAARCLSMERPGARGYGTLLILAPLVASARYEGLFLVAVVGVLFLLRGEMLSAMGLLGMGLLPVAIYGAVSVGKGWFFLPNSLLLKPTMPSLGSIGEVVEVLGKAGVRRICASPHLLVLILPSLMAVLFEGGRRGRAWESVSMWSNAAFIGTTLLHLQLVGYGWTYRYEGYLVALGVIVIAGTAGELFPEELSLPIRRDRLAPYLAAGVLVIVVTYPLAKRAVPVLLSTPQATTNIFEQQYQMGLFLHQFYEGQTIAANDIGAINYLADIHLVDLEGLATLSVANLKMKSGYDASQIKLLNEREGTAIAVIYESWYGGIREEWKKVGEWKIRDNVICAEDTVSFWSVDPSREAGLIANLRAFAGQLPETVGQSGEYLRYEPTGALPRGPFLPKFSRK